MAFPRKRCSPPKPASRPLLCKGDRYTLKNSTIQWSFHLFPASKAVFGFGWIHSTTPFFSRSTSTFHHIHCEHSSLGARGRPFSLLSLSPSLALRPSITFFGPYHSTLKTGDVTLNRAKQRLKYLLHPLSTSHPPGLLNHVNTLTFAYCCYRSPFFQVKTQPPPTLPLLTTRPLFLLARPFLQVFFAQNLTNTLFFQLHTTQADNRLNPQPEPFWFGPHFTALSLCPDEPTTVSVFLVHLISEHSI